MSCVRKQTNVFKEADKGSVAIMFAMTMTIVLGIVGGAVDFARAFKERIRLQAAVDAAAIAGARAVALKLGDPKLMAESTFGANYTGTTASVTVTGAKVHVNAVYNMQTQLLQLLGLPNLSIDASANAQPSFETVYKPSVDGGNVCILLLDTFKEDSLDVGSAATTVIAPDCEVHVKSTRSSAAASFHTNGTFDVAKSCIAGDYTTNGGNRGVTGPIEKNCTTVNDPFAGTLPVPSIQSCKPSRNLNNSTEYMTPGTYCGNWHFKGGVNTISMAPSVYVLKESVWKFNGKMVGSGVTIYFADSESYLNTNGQGTLDIQAPTDESDPYKGILIYESSSISHITSLQINGGQNAIVKGLIYLPSRDMKWNGNSGVDADSLTLVLNSLEVTGTTTWRVKPFESFGIKSVGSGGTTEQVMTSIKLFTN